MDALTFVATLVQALAWPLAAVAGLCILRGPLFALAQLLRRVRYGDLEFAFEERIAALKEEASTALPPPTPARGEPTIPEHLARLAATSPRAALIEAWAQVAAAAVEALKRKGAPLPSDFSRRTPQVEKLLVEKGILDQPQISVLRRLRSTRNAAAHTPKRALDEAVALEYIATARRLKALMDSK